jgi:hypothetical protein
MSYPEIGKLMDDVFPVVPPRHHGVVKERHHRQILHTCNKLCGMKKTTCLWKKYMSILVQDFNSADLLTVFRIRIRIGSGFNQVSGSRFGIRIQEGKIGPQK